MNLSPMQVEAFDKIMKWFKDPKQKRFVLAGYAGTGKSTLARHLADVIGAGNIYYAAYTGKAVNVLREKGCQNVNTIHGYTYELSHSDHNQKPVFVRVMNGILKHAPLVILDEYSMLPRKIVEDLEASCGKILYLGDPFQLPPVNGDCPLNPDFFLTEIHRQALDSPIIRYATMVREGKSFGGFVDEGSFVYTHSKNIPSETFFEVEQIIVGTNKTRHKTNDWFREKIYGEDKTLYPIAGEKMICLLNNHELGIFNGMIEKSSGAWDIKKDSFKMHFGALQNLKVWDGDIKGKENYVFSRDNRLERFGYAYAITAHKSQGSEFKSVLIKNEPTGSTEELRRRWMYTAVTRAQEKCILIA